MSTRREPVRRRLTTPGLLAGTTAVIASAVLALTTATAGAAPPGGRHHHQHPDPHRVDTQRTGTDRTGTEQDVAPWQYWESGRWHSRSTLGTLGTPRPMPRMVRVAATTIAPGLEHSQYDNGVVEADVLEADLTEPSLGIAYTSPGTVASSAVMTSQAKASGTIAAVNGDFFDISDTKAPRGVGVVDGAMRHGPLSGWNDGVAFTSDGGTDVGRLARITLDATVTLPSGTTLEPTNLNSPNVAKNGIGIYTPDWGSVARTRVVDGASGVREVEVRDGVVTAVRTSAGGSAVPDGALVLLGREDGAADLAGLAVGDEVAVTYRPRYDTGTSAETAITGNLVLLRDGEVTTVDHPRHPRTGVGFSADGTRMWLVALDGRSTASRGMTYVEFGNFLKSLGADDALNLDGGGSTTMVAKMPGEVELSVQNAPSDGAQRPVPNGLGFTSTTFPPGCVRATLDFPSYAPLAPGASGSAVLAAECLLKAAGAFSGTPNTTYDAATETAVKAFQSDKGIPSDGVVGQSTWTALLSAGARPTLREGSSGLAVKRLQRALTAALGRTVGIDGVFGPLTDAAVRDYQRTRELDVDGIVGPDTWGALQAGE
ncbi:MAG TPA: phosphodiester glycosidase family protein [Actinopolymorphaceae bacterium]